MTRSWRKRGNLRANKLFVGDRVREFRRRVGGARGGNAVEGPPHGAVSDGVNVDDQSLFIREDAEIRKLFRIEQEFAVSPVFLYGLVKCAVCEGNSATPSAKTLIPVR